MKEQNLENMIWEGRGKKTQQNSDRDNSNLCEIHNNLSAQCACFEILQYNTLVPCADGTNDSSTKRLMFQVLFFFHKILQNSLQKPFQFIFLFFL